MENVQMVCSHRWFFHEWPVAPEVLKDEGNAHLCAASIHTKQGNGAQYIASTWRKCVGHATIMRATWSGSTNGTKPSPFQQGTSHLRESIFSNLVTQRQQRCIKTDCSFHGRLWETRYFLPH
jgi:hypothetical protein